MRICKKNNERKMFLNSFAIVNVWYCSVHPQVLSFRIKSEIVSFFPFQKTGWLFWISGSENFENIAITGGSGQKLWSSTIAVAAWLSSYCFSMKRNSRLHFSHCTIVHCTWMLLDGKRKLNIDVCDVSMDHRLNIYFDLLGKRSLRTFVSLATIASLADFYFFAV